MRIVSGSYKGRVISPPKSFRARPTTDTAKEGLFNILNNNFYFEDISVLDLFSGTGSISFEFASRGCNSIHLIEINSSHFRFINSVINKLGIESIRPIRTDAFKFLKSCKNKFDIIFADPPYDLNGIEQIPEIVFSRNLLNNNGWLILEHSNHQNFSENPHFTETRKYGNVNFSLFKI
ncbi:MAG: 16S rRNA (guanine(966)-N(2))-methyltransferase RsmD [Perlabentimonas sp.]